MVNCAVVWTCMQCWLAACLTLWSHSTSLLFMLKCWKTRWTQFQTIFLLVSYVMHHSAWTTHGGHTPPATCIPCTLCSRGTYMYLCCSFKSYYNIARSNFLFHIHRIHRFLIMSFVASPDQNVRICCTVSFVPIPLRGSQWRTSWLILGWVGEALCHLGQLLSLINSL